MKTYLIIIFLASVSIGAQAQQFSVKGRLVGSDGKGLPSATVLLLNARDSIMTNFAISNTDGQFVIRNIAYGNYLIRLSYVGYATVTFGLHFPDDRVLDLGDIKLPEEARLLREVTISQERVPMRIKNDTIEYDVLAFRPLPNEMVEDLLKRMPGMVVSSDGTVEAQGEQVRRVLVDGREFFGRDPRMATQNISADAVAKVQVFDQRSEQEIFTGIDDGLQERTINLELREDRREAAFGNTSMGYGPDNRFHGRANLNRFDTKGQISLLAMGNNVNQQGFSTGDFMNFSGAAQSFARGRGNFQFGGSQNQMGVPINFDGRASSNGLITSWAGGLNFNQRFSPNTEITTSYFYNQMDHNISEDLARENFLPTGNFNYHQSQLNDNQNYNHRINLRLDHKFNEKSSILLTANSNFNLSEITGSTTGQTFGPNENIQNSSIQTINSDGQNFNVNASLLWRQRLAKPGRTFAVGFDMVHGSNDMDMNLNALNSFFVPINTSDSLLQNQLRNDWNRRLSGHISVTEHLINRIFLEGSFMISHATDKIDLRVFDLGQPDNAGEFNQHLSNQHENAFLFQRSNINLRINNDRLNFSIGSAIQASKIEGYSITLNQQVKRNYFHLLPVARLNYEFTSFRRVSVEYETSVREPSAMQIQPVIDNRDPLHVFKGNPGLLPSYVQRVNIRFHSFNPATSFGYFFNLSADHINNAITNSVTIDELFVRTTMPVNVDNNINFRFNASANIDIRPIRSRIMPGTSLTRMQSVNLLNGISQEITNNMFSPNLRVTFNPLQHLELRLMASLNHQLTRYEFHSAEQAFLNQTYQAEINWNFFDHYRLDGSFNYSIFQGRTSEFDRKIPILNLGFSRSMLKNNSGEIRLSVFNLLDSNLGITQNTGINYHQRSITNSLGRYFLLTFTWSLNRQLNMINRHPGQWFRGPRGMR